MESKTNAGVSDTIVSDLQCKQIVNHNIIAKKITTFDRFAKLLMKQKKSLSNKTRTHCILGSNDRSR